MRSRLLCYQGFLYAFCYIDLQIFMMSDPIIPPYPQHSDTTVNGPPPPQRPEPHPPVSPSLEDVLAAAAVVPSRNIPSTYHARPFIRGPPPSTPSSTRGSSIHTSFCTASDPVPYHEFEAMRMERQYLLGQVREMERIIQMMDPSRAERELRQRIVDVRMNAMEKLNTVAEGYGDLADWAIWMMSELDTFRGPTFPGS